MYKLKRLLGLLTTCVLLILVGCQDAQPSQQVSSTVDRAKVASTLDKFQAVTEDSAEAYMNLSIEEMEVFIDLSYQRQLRQLERNPVGYCTVFFDAKGQKVDVYNPEGEVKERKVRLSGKGLAERRAEIEQSQQWFLAVHRLSVERYGVSYNAVSGEQLDALGDALPSGSNDQLKLCN